MCGGSGGRGKKGGGGGGSTNGDAGQPGEVYRAAQLRAKHLDLAKTAVSAKAKDLKTWSDAKLSNAISAIREYQHLDPNNRAEDRIIRERLRRF